MDAYAADTSLAGDPPLPLVPDVVVASAPSIRVALVDSGVNYLLPQIQRSLARTRDGQLVGYDFWDMDEYPFDSHPLSSGQIQRHGTQTASLLISEAPFVKLVPYRYPRPDMKRMAQLLEHADANDVRIVGLPLGGNKKEEWTVFESAAALYPHILFIASAGNNGRNIDQEPVYPASLDIPNMLVVTSADDFVKPADGVNWGRSSVDYLVPAEMQSVTTFNGAKRLVSGSSYAVPRVLALAARLLRQSPTLDADGLMGEIRRQFANGAAPRQIGHGYIHDPRLDAINNISVASETQWVAPQMLGKDASEMSALKTLSIPLDVLVLDSQWSADTVRLILDEAQTILSQCDVVFKAVNIRYIDVPDYLSDLETGASKTLMDAVRLSGPNRQATVVFARDTRMNQAYDAEAFGKANTRNRAWLSDSVWLTLALKDRGIGLAHELFHVLANSGRHNAMAGNLMLTRTTGNNRKLVLEQCLSMRENIVNAGLNDVK